MYVLSRGDSVCASVVSAAREAVRSMSPVDVLDLPSCLTRLCVSSVRE